MTTLPAGWQATSPAASSDVAAGFSVGLAVLCICAIGRDLVIGSSLSPEALRDR